LSPAPGFPIGCQELRDYHYFKTSFDQIQPGVSLAKHPAISSSLYTLEELKWRSNWADIIATMLENKPILFGDN
jgi:hypothetical protein